MSHRILVVDDDAHIRQVLALKLRNADYEVDVAEDGEDALARIARRRPDLVITDLQMPYMDGVALIERIGADEATRDLPVVLLTARGYGLDESRLDGSVVRGMIAKPFSPRRILDLVRSILEGDSEIATRPEAA